MINASDVKVIHIDELVWSPVILESNYNTLQIEQDLLEIESGISYNISPLFENVQDISINNGSLLMLTNPLPADRIFKEKLNHSNIKDLLKFTALKVQKNKESITTTGFFKTNNISNTKEIIHSAEESVLEYLTFIDNKIQSTKKLKTYKDNIFNFNFNGKYVSVSNLRDMYLTYRGSQVYVGNIATNFDYILNDVSIILFEKDTNFSNILVFDILSNMFYIKSLTTGEDIPDNSILYIEHFEDFNFHTSTIKDSFIAKYNVNALSAANSIELDPEIKNTQYNQNYLVNIPLQSKSNKYTAYINSLKNYQTANHEYSISNNNLSNRRYTNIFTGNNQKNGYENIFLNYTSPILEKTLKKDTNTLFHCPGTIATSGVHISAAGFIQDGAIASNIPFTSDRISYSRRDYRELGIPQVSSVIADNTWLYAWLSAGPLGESVWMDRFYTGATFDENTHEVLLGVTNTSLIIDIPSTMMLYPYRVYDYFHQGFNNIKNYINNFNSIDRENNTTILEINDWSSTSLKDSSSHKNDGIISLNTDILQKDFLQLNGKNYALFPATTINEFKQLTVGFWYNVDDWNNIEGTQIIGNFSDSGFGLFNKQTTPTSFISVYDNLNGYIYNFNNSFKILNEQKITTSIDGLAYLMRTTDQSYWIIYSNQSNSYAIKYDLNNNISTIGAVVLTDIQNIDQVEFDSLENIYVYDKRKKIFIVINSLTGEIILSKEVPSSFDRIELLYNNTTNFTYPTIFFNIKSNTTVVGIDAHTSVTDNQNNIWSSVGVNLYKNKDFYATVGKITYLTCDIYNSIWILHDNNKLSKINTQKNVIEFTKIVSSTVFDTTNLVPKRYINFITINSLNKETPYAIIIDNHEKVSYTVSMDGDIVNTINLLAVPSTFLSKRNFDRNSINFTAGGDFTGYQYQRKFNNSYELIWKVGTTLSSNLNSTNNSEIFNLSFSTKNFNPGWHYFSFVFDHAVGYMSAYVDGILLNTLNFTPFTHKIKRSNKPLSIGAITTEQGILNDTIGLNKSQKVVGKIAHLHAYKYAFNIHDINHLYKGTFFDMYQDLIWNINIGSRNYIEQIEKFFMHKMPGHKSKYFNIKIKNLPVTSGQEDLIKEAIRNVITKIVPADTTLNKIIWE